MLRVAIIPTYIPISLFHSVFPGLAKVKMSLYLDKKLSPPAPPLTIRKEYAAAHLARPRISESFPVLSFCRATAFGILNGLCKFGAILGNTIFASFVGITKVVPILLAAASLVGGGLIALRLPETREQVLMWTTHPEKADGKNFFRTLQHSHTSCLSLSTGYHGQLRRRNGLCDP